MQIKRELKDTDEWLRNSWVIHRCTTGLAFPFDERRKERDQSWLNARLVWINESLRNFYPGFEIRQPAVEVHRHSVLTQRQEAYYAMTENGLFGVSAYDCFRGCRILRSSDFIADCALTLSRNSFHRFNDNANDVQYTSLMIKIKHSDVEQAQLKLLPLRLLLWRRWICLKVWNLLIDTSDSFISAKLNANWFDVWRRKLLI